MKKILAILLALVFAFAFAGCGGSESTQEDETTAAETEAVEEASEVAGEELFGFCYDVGHATLLGKDQRRSVGLIGSRLKTLHIHDNDGRNDVHFQPYAYSRGSGYVTDWEGFLEGLRDVGYSGTISFETDNALDSLPQPLKRVMLTYIAGVGRYFADQVSST